MVHGFQKYEHLTIQEVVEAAQEVQEYYDGLDSILRVVVAKEVGLKFFSGAYANGIYTHSDKELLSEIKAALESLKKKPLEKRLRYIATSIEFLCPDDTMERNKIYFENEMLELTKKKKELADAFEKLAEREKTMNNELVEKLLAKERAIDEVKIKEEGRREALKELQEILSTKNSGSLVNELIKMRRNEEI